ncbi:MAG: PilN domain-containing protein [Sulfuricellaceae bacterium]|nr:PilN domain-containing protein [Sulfuricellaceae bacterium]
MTVRINLLPHREQKRAARQKQFIVLAGMTAGLGLVVALAGHVFFSGQIDNQDSRNNFLKTEMSKLDKEIEEIKDIKEKTNSLLERKKVVESLQSNRSQIVHLFDQMVKQLPDGVYLKQVDQKGKTIKLVGYAQSNARVASLMRNLDASPWLEGSTLIEAKAAMVNGLRVNEFTMEVKLTAPQQDVEEKKTSKKTASTNLVGGHPV